MPTEWHSRFDHGTVSSFRVEVVDSTGAGDAFMGGILYSLAQLNLSRPEFSALVNRTEEVKKLVKFAAAVGALSVGRHGAFASMPKLCEVNHLLRVNGHENHQSKF